MTAVGNLPSKLTMICRQEMVQEASSWAGRRLVSVLVAITAYAGIIAVYPEALTHFSLALLYWFGVLCIFLYLDTSYLAYWLSRLHSDSDLLIVGRNRIQKSSILRVVFDEAVGSALVVWLSAESLENGYLIEGLGTSEKRELQSLKSEFPTKVRTGPIDVDGLWAFAEVQIRRARFPSVVAMGHFGFALYGLFVLALGVTLGGPDLVFVGGVITLVSLVMGAQQFDHVVVRGRSMELRRVLFETISTSRPPGIFEVQSKPLWKGADLMTLIPWLKHYGKRLLQVPELGISPSQ